jgi:hypothetical protein
VLQTEINMHNPNCMKKIIILSLIVLISCDKDNDLKDYIVAGSSDGSISYYDLIPDVDLDFYVPGGFDLQIDGENLINIGAIVVVPYPGTSAEVSCDIIDTTWRSASHSNTHVFYIFAQGNMNPYDKTDVINNSGIWTDPSWASYIDISRGHGWTVGEKKYIGFRYKNKNHHFLRKDHEYLYGWVGVIITDSLKLSVDDYAYQED